MKTNKTAKATLRQPILCALIAGGFIPTTASAATIPPAAVPSSRPAILRAEADDLTLPGTVTDAATGQPMPFVLVSLPELNLWAETNEKGRFHFDGLRPGTYKIEVRSTGYKTHSTTVTLSASTAPLSVKLQKLSLSLSEVVVTAEAQRMGSSSRIDRTAVQHIQPKSLEDLMQLVPGNITKNPDLNSVGQAYIRELDTDANNALGTLVVVDGTPLSNDANLQTLSTSKRGTTPSQSTAGRGVDLRLVSPDNIESVEVVRGIPGAEYGNLTSGAVIVKTRAGATPLEVKLKADPFSKMVYAGKGFNLQRSGSVNLSADYSQSYTDIRKKYAGYDRITFSSAYSNVFMKSTRPLSLNARLALFSSLNNEKTDPELLYNERINNKTIGGRLSLEGNWSLNLPWISGLSYAASASYTHESDYSNRQVLLQSGITPVGHATADSEYATFYLSSTYYAWSKVVGTPLDLYAQVKATKLLQMGDGAYMNFKLGADWRFNKNNGQGLTFDMQHPPQVTNNQSLRPRPYADIPAMNQLAWFLEDKYTQPLGTTQLTLQAGLRLSTLFVDESQAHRGHVTTAEPRVNLDFNLLNSRNNRLFDDLSLVGGYGIAAKAPTLLQLYPDKAYFDVTSYTMLFRDDVSGAAGKSLAVMTTRVIDDTTNPQLKPARSQKFEGGFSFRIRKVKGMVNFFYEQHRDEFGYTTRPVLMTANTYLTPDAIDAVRYADGRVQYQSAGSPLWTDANVAPRTYFYYYSTPSNSTRTEKIGVEYQLQLATIPALRTSVTVDGAYLRIRRRDSEEYFSPISDTYNGGLYPLMPLLPGGSGTVSSRFNTNFRFITHIPQLRMVFTTTLQMIWTDTSRRIYENDLGQSLVYRMEDPFAPGTEKYFVNPVGFIDANGQYSPWQSGFETDPLYRYMLLSYSHDRTFDTERMPVSAILNFRLSKEFGRWLDVAFMANNFLKLNKSHKLRTTNGWRDITIPLYFGAEVNIKF